MTQYRSEAWQEVAHSFDNGFAQYGWEPYRLNILKWALDVTKDSLLDVACCRGAISQAIIEGGFSGRLVGVDITPAFVEDARSKGIDARVADARSLPFEDAEFETVLLLNVIMHLDKPQEAVAEAARVARKFLIISSYVANEPTPYHDNLGPEPKTLKEKWVREFREKFLSWAYPDETLRSFVPTGWVCKETARFPLRGKEVIQYLFERE